MMVGKLEIPLGDGDDSVVDSGTDSLADEKAHSSTSGSGAGNGTSEDESKEELFKRESQQVAGLKKFVILLLLLSGVAVTVLVYTVTSRAEQEEFVATYEGAAEKLINTFYEIVSVRLGALSALSVAATALKNDANKTWPFVSLSFNEYRLKTTRKLAGVMFISLNPLVSEADREAWENYSYGISSDHWSDIWYPQGKDYQEKLNYSRYGIPPQLKTNFTLEAAEPELDVSAGVANRVYTLNQNRRAVIDRSEGPYLPTWQTSPIFEDTIVNENILSDPMATQAARQAIEKAQVVFGPIEAGVRSGHPNATFQTDFQTMLMSVQTERYYPYGGSPSSRVYVPIFDRFEKDQNKVVGVMVAIIRWRYFFKDILPSNINGLYMVLSNGCGDTFTMVIDNTDPTGEPVVVGFGDKHETEYDHMERSVSFRQVALMEDGTPEGLSIDNDYCSYTLKLYPSNEAKASFSSGMPLTVTLSVAAVFLFCLGMFICYDYLVERRQQLILARAERSGAIVSSLFPKAVQERLMKEAEEKEKLKNSGMLQSKNQRLKTFLNGDDEQRDKCIADLFPDATVLFADISGFTAWSSVRDPSQVFHLLESVYNSFDRIAKSRKVFKVETIGDCYVAVTGLPDPQPQHAVIMARFTMDCLSKMHAVVRDLSTTLGPDTADLTMRFGIHSGPVTAGVLRGEKSRFQLFGDTVNTASRIESTGQRGKIQVSKETAELLIAAGKDHWLIPREDQINAKGKGILKTYWLKATTAKKSAGSVSSGGTVTCSETMEMIEEVPIAEATNAKVKCRVDWMTDLLTSYLRQILVHRASLPASKRKTALTPHGSEELIAINEVVEFIKLLPNDGSTTVQTKVDLDSIKVEPDVVDQLRTYVTAIAAMYNDNPFHNFEHACHVTQSVSKFLKRIVTPEIDEENVKTCGEAETKKLLHDYTHGINSDPITQFAIVFSGLIHDADHKGISNAQLAKENPEMARHFSDKSIAEQHSVESAWSLLMSEQFKQLRSCLFVTQDEFATFRQVIVNVVMATDIFDKELNEQRKNRWNKAFSEGNIEGKYKSALQATIVIEHIIQASDVAHTMQHWIVYRQWNKLLFKEMLIAYHSGRMAVDPRTFWYQGELGFFDNYIIPLAKKLKDCAVFGANSDECLTYATRNRDEWEAHGQAAVADMIEECKDLEVQSKEAHA